MFEIVVNEAQILNTFHKFKENQSLFQSKELNLCFKLLEECRFIIKTFNKSEFIDKLKQLGEDKLFWAGNHVRLDENNESLENNPFRYYLDENQNDLLYEPLLNCLSEKEIIVKKGNSINAWEIKNQESKYADEILVYDPYLIPNLDISIATISSIAAKANCNPIAKYIFFSTTKGPTTKSQIDLFLQGLTKHNINKENIAIVILDNVYHDRELISNTLRIKAGDSFDFLKPGTDVIQKNAASTINLKSMLVSDTHQSTWEIINILFKGYENKFKGKKLYLPHEKDFALKLETTILYNYWNTFKE